MNVHTLLTLVSLALLHQLCSGAKWHYHGPLGPNAWPTINGSSCGGQRQSPININTYQVVPIDLGEFKFEGLNPTPEQTWPGGGAAAPGGGGGAAAPGGGGAAGGNGAGGGFWSPGWGNGGGWNQGWGSTWNQFWNGQTQNTPQNPAQNSPQNSHPQWSNPFGNLRRYPANTRPFGAGGPTDTMSPSDNGLGPAPRALHRYGSAQHRKVEVSNDGHTLKVSLENFYMLNGGSLPTYYKPAQLHFHWGNSHDRGSEHTVNNRAYAAELHLVHYHSKYRDIGEAINNPDGLAVLGFFIEGSDIENPAFDPLLDITENVKFKGSKVEYYAPLPLLEMLPRDLVSYYRYNGSLTVPMCQETVIWTVFKESIKLSHNQLDMFRELYQGFFLEPNGQLELLHIEDNFRPTQPIFSRQVLESGNGRNGMNGRHIPGQRFSATASSNAVIPTKLFTLFALVIAVICRSL